MKMKKMPARGLCVVFFLLIPSAAALLYWIMMPLPDRDRPETRFLRAAHVLQRLGGPAAREPENIPPHIAYSDATESLLHHPDKIYVLRHVADDLAAVAGQVPGARLYEAYARLGLGEKRQAAALLAGHVVENPYDAAHYSLLSDTLRELGDYQSLLLICREWAERDPSCREERTRHVWSALYKLDRYEQALDYLAGEEACLGWEAGVYAAKTHHAMKDEERAEQKLRDTLKAYPSENDSIRRMWELLKDRTVM